VAVPLGQLLVNVGGCSLRAAGRISRVALVRAGGSTRLATIVFDSGPPDKAGIFDAVSATTASVSWTGCDGRSAVSPADEGAVASAGVAGVPASGVWTWADAGAGTAFCLDAK
jgi:hypothetical protein